MNAPITKPPQPTALQATAERLLSRGLVGAGWWLADDERLVGAIVDRSMRPAPRWGAASELASQLDGLSLRTKPTSPEPGVSAWPLLEREDRALWLQRRREGPRYQFAVAWGELPVPAPAKPVRRPAPVRDWAAAAAGEAQEERPVVSCAAELRAPPPERPVLHPHAESTSPAEAPAPATAQLLRAVEDQAVAAALVVPASPAPSPEAPAALEASAEASVLHPHAGDTSPPPAEPAGAPLPAGPRRAAALACKEAGCEQLATSRGLCKLHYDRDWRRRQVSTKALSRRVPVATVERVTGAEPGVCPEPGCGQPAAVRGWCKRCYNRRWSAQRRLGLEAPPVRGAHPLKGQSLRGREQTARAAWLALCSNPVAGPWQVPLPTKTTQTWERRTIGLVTKPVIALVGRQTGGKWSRWEALLWPISEGGDPQKLTGFTSRRQAEAVAEAEARRIGWVLV